MAIAPFQKPWAQATFNEIERRVMREFRQTITDVYTGYTRVVSFGAYSANFWYWTPIAETTAGKPFTAKDISADIVRPVDERGFVQPNAMEVCDECPGGRHARGTLVHAHILGKYLAPLVANVDIDADLARVLDAVETKQMVASWSGEHDDRWEEWQGAWSTFDVMRTGRTSSRHPNFANIRRSTVIASQKKKKR